MKQLSTVALLLGMIFHVGYAQELKVVQEYGIPQQTKVKTFTQPNGERITLEMHGNALANYVTNLNGEVVVKNQEGYWVVNTSKGAVAQTTSLGKVKSTQVKSGEMGARAFPHTGNPKLLVIIADYADYPHQISKEDIYKTLTQPNYNGTGSLRDYYLDNSNGQLNLDIVLTDWITLPKNRAEYAANWPLMAYDALATADAVVDYTQFDNTGDGAVESVAILHVGEGQEASYDPLDIWSHNLNLLEAGYDTAQMTFDGVVLNNYFTQPELVDGGVAEIGVFAHEFGHALGAMDMYDVLTNEDGVQDGTGGYDLMCYGSYNGERSGSQPAYMNPYYRGEVFDWMPVKELKNPETVKMFTDANYDTIYKIAAAAEGEYHYVSNYTPVKNNVYLPDHGLVLFHYDSLVFDSLEYYNYVNSYSRQGFYIKPPDVGSRLDGEGGAFPFLAIDAITDSTEVSLQDHLGQVSGHTIEHIVVSDTVIYFDFDGGDPTALKGNVIAVTDSWAEVNFYNSSQEPLLVVVNQDTVAAVPTMNEQVGDALSDGSLVVRTQAETKALLNDLNANTEYQIKWWSRSGKEGVLNFTTQQEPIHIYPYTEEFSSVEWSQKNHGTSNLVWSKNNVLNRNIQTTSAANGFYIADSEFEGVNEVQNAELYSPVFNFSSASKVEVSFEYQFEKVKESTTTFEYSIDEGTTWSKVYDLTDHGGATALAQMEFLSEFSGLPRVQFRWVFGASNEKYCAIDDFKVEIEDEDFPAVVDLRADTVNGQLLVQWNPAINSLPNGYEVTVNGQVVQTNAQTTYTAALNSAEYEIDVVAQYTGGNSVDKTIEVINIVALPANNLKVEYKGLGFGALIEWEKADNHNEDYFLGYNVYVGGSILTQLSQSTSYTHLYSYTDRVYSYTVEAIYENALSAHSTIILDTHEDVNSVQEIAVDDRISVYPNPSSDYILLQADETIELVNIYSLEGKLVKQETVGNYQSTISVSDLKTGVYIIELQTKETSYQTKLIKN